MSGSTVRGLYAGQAASLEVTVTEALVQAFAEVTGDRNPLHLDEAAAAHGPFGRRVAHGMLGAGLFSALLGTRLPGPGTIYLEQSLRFLAPVFVGDQVTATVTILEPPSERGRLRLRTELVRADGVLAITGEALVKVPPEEGGA
jgi:3-hydroxybutyryl-CoA dehydratase